MRAPIHSRKHYVQKSLTTVLAGAVNTFEIAQSVLPGGTDLVNEVVEGALVKAVYIELWVRGQDTSPGSFVVIVEKLPGTATAITAGFMAALGTYENKKNILFTSQALTNVNTADAIPILRTWLKIPKGKQRMGLDDRLRLTFFSQALDSNICGFATYKEYT